MKANKFFTVLLLGVVVLSSISFEMQASQSWYDWGRSGLSSGYEAMRGMYGRLPSIPESMSNIVNSMSQVRKEKWLVAIGVALLGTAGGTALYKWYQKYKAEQDEMAKKEEAINECINDIKGLFLFKESGKKSSDPSYKQKTFSKYEQYKFFADHWKTPFFKWIIKKYDKNVFVAAMNIVLEDNHLNIKSPLKVLKINEQSGDIMETFISKKAEKEQKIMNISEISPQEKALHENMKKSCERAKDKYSCLLVAWKNHINDTWWDEYLGKEIKYDNKTIVGVTNRLLEEYYPMSEHNKRAIAITPIIEEDVIGLKKTLFLG